MKVVLFHRVVRNVRIANCYFYYALQRPRLAGHLFIDYLQLITVLVICKFMSNDIFPSLTTCFNQYNSTLD